MNKYLLITTHLSAIQLYLEVLCRLLRYSSSKVQLVDLCSLIPQRLFIGHNVNKSLAAQTAVFSFICLTRLDLFQLTCHAQAAFVLPALLTTLVLVHELITTNEQLWLALRAVLEFICGSAHLLGFVELLSLALGFLLLSAAKPWAGNECVKVRQCSSFLSGLAFRDIGHVGLLGPAVQPLTTLLTEAL